MKTYLSIIFTVLIIACSLEEEILDEASGEELLDQQVDLNIAAPAYGWLVEVFDGDDTWAVLNVTSDEMIVPTRGLNWADNGIWISLHQHTWIPSNPVITEFWEVLSRGAALANTALFLYQDRIATGDEDLIKTLVAEMRFLRAYYRYLKLDLFRQVPMRDENDQDFDQPPPVLGPLVAFDWLIAELQALIPDLAEKNGLNNGRVSRDAAYALLAKIYLNSEIYIGSARWQQCLEACDILIQSGQYSLAPDYFDIFGLQNEIQNPEAIFVVRQNETVAKGVFGISPATTLYYNQDLGFGKQTFNGYAATENFFYSWDQDGDLSNGVFSTDARFQEPSYKALTGANLGFLEGPQVHPDGSPITDSQLTGSSGNFVQLDYTAEIGDIGNALDHEGVRILKYEPDPNSRIWFMGRNAFMILRYADIWLMKAEALMRLGRMDEALAMVNQLRQVRNAPALIELTEAALLDERRFELYWEGWRRQDLIRFGQFTGTWTFKESSEPFREVFPIPETAIGVNPGLIQNPGYD